MSLKKNIDNWQQRSKKDLTKNYIKVGLKASGNWARKLEPKTKIKVDKITVSMEAPGYTEEMKHGRGPTKKDGNGTVIKRIKQWVKDKPVLGNPYAITKTIHKHGTLQYRQPKANKTNFISDVITPKRIRELVDIVGEEILFDIRTTIKKVF
jgi:hypothetical protein